MYLCISDVYDLKFAVSLETKNLIHVLTSNVIKNVRITMTMCVYSCYVSN